MIYKYAKRLWAACAIVFFGAQSVFANEAAQLRAGLDHAARKSWSEALFAVPDGIGRHVIAWQALRDGYGRLQDFEAFLQVSADWPGLDLIREQGEALLPQINDPQRVLAYFGRNAPRTANGALALIRAHLAVGAKEQARDVAHKAWGRLAFGSTQQEDLFRLLPQDAFAHLHANRHEDLLWEGKWQEAGRMAHLVPNLAAPLVQAREALRTDKNGIDRYINAVPPQFANHPALAYERFSWQMRRDRYDTAAQMIMAQSKDAKSLGRPGAWATRRKLLAHRYMRENEPKTAYRIAANHHLSPGPDYADLEFLSGFIALRRLGDTQTALAHFQRLEAAVETPISISRALYWQGRSYESMGDTRKAREVYTQAARHHTAYYGLLAGEKLGQSLEPALVTPPKAPRWKNAAWTGSSVHGAALLLREAGDNTLAERFWLHLAESLDAQGLGEISAMAIDLNEPHLAVLLGKLAARKGIILHEAYFPVPNILPNEGLSVSHAFALAIARRESEFDPKAQSSANARGLMQLLPATARQMAQKIGESFNIDRLSSDPAYNARLGTAYLAHLSQDFGTSVALLAAGYNAGPSRAHQWIAAHGDPRDPATDIIDWVEMIPFEETRIYVMRVTEGLVIYRARLAGKTRPINITAELRGG